MKPTAPFRYLALMFVFLFVACEQKPEPVTPPVIGQTNGHCYPNTYCHVFTPSSLTSSRPTVHTDTYHYPNPYAHDSRTLGWEHRFTPFPRR